MRPYNLILLLLIFNCLNACSTHSRRIVPPGEIPQARPVTPSEEQIGHQLLDELSKKYKLDYSHPRRSSVDKIVKKLTAAAGADKLPWHIHVFDDASVKNAAATKGNHIFIWTGMIDATQNDDELASVLSHEVSHILAKHTDPSDAEIFRKTLVDIGALALGAAAGVASSGTIAAGTAQDIAASLTREVGSGLLVYPYARSKELEADQIGLFLMMKAGFDPHGALSFWSRALNDPSFGQGTAFFSTHPPAAERLENLRALIPLVLKSKGGQATTISPSTAIKRGSTTTKNTQWEPNPDFVPAKPNNTGISHPPKPTQNTTPLEADDSFSASP